MPQFTEDCEVEKIITTTKPIQPFIDAAVAVTDDCFNGVSISNDLLKQIQTWLTAHLIEMSEGRGRVKSEKVLSASITYDTSTGMGLDGTTYGQMAKTLDSTGCLATLGQKKVGLWNL